MNELVEKEGKAIIMISSEMEELMGMSDRIVVLSEGNMTGSLEKSEFSQETNHGICIRSENGGGLNHMKSNVGSKLKEHAIWIVLVVLVIGFTVANPRFVNPSNIFTLLRQVAVFGIASIGMTFVILLADIDLSIGSIMSFVNVVCAYLMVNAGVNWILATLITLVLSTW